MYELHTSTGLGLSTAHFKYINIVSICEIPDHAGSTSQRDSAYDRIHPQLAKEQIQSSQY